LLPAQQICPGPPQAWQVPPKPPPLQTAPSLQAGGSSKLCWQQGCPGPPQATHSPPLAPGMGMGDGKGVEVCAQVLPGSRQLLPQQGSLGPPQLEHLPALQVPPPP
jgi:hypothetical protein